MSTFTVGDPFAAMISGIDPAAMCSPMQCGPYQIVYQGTATLTITVEGATTVYAIAGITTFNNPPYFDWGAQYVGGQGAIGIASDASVPSDLPPMPATAGCTTFHGVCYDASVTLNPDADAFGDVTSFALTNDGAILSGEIQSIKTTPLPSAFWLLAAPLLLAAWKAKR